MMTFFKFIFFGSLILISTQQTTVGQNLNRQVSLDSAKAVKIPFYKWEVGIDALPLINQSKDPFGYVLKRNFQTENGRQAVRLKLLPRLSYSSVGGTVSNPSLYIAVGYEWQKLYGRFGFLYGLEPFFRYDKNLVVGQSNSSRSEAKQINVGMNGFIGGRYYIGNHFSVSVESHLVYNYYSGRITNVGNVSSGNARQHTGFLNPIHAVYFSYHF